MKKHLLLILVFALVFCLAACEKAAPDGNSGVTYSQADSESEISKADGNEISSTPESSNEETPIPSTSPPTVSTPPHTEPGKTNEVVVLPPITDTYQDKYRPNYLLGNCKNLKGNPLVILLFIDDDESAWSSKEVTEYTDKYINVGLKYLEDKAAEWGVDLDFSIKSYSSPLSDYTLKYEGCVIKDLRVNGSSKDVLDQAALDMGYSSNWELYSKFKTEHGNNDDIIFLTFINKAGKSYARHMISTGRTDYSEHCVIFADYLEGPSFGCKASTVAHELLHLFGAEDFYSGYRELLAYQTYPKDIMLWMPNEAYENQIGDFTAYSVGWTNTVPQICYNEYWWK